jgi:anti-anti-sigma factor
LKLLISPRDDDTLVVCADRLTANVKEEFKNQISALIPQAKRIVLDLSNVSHMDSAGLGVMVGLYISTKAAGSDFLLINLSKPVSELLGMTNVLLVFESCGQCPEGERVARRVESD